MSYRHFFGSSCVEQRPGLVHRLAEVRVLDRRVDDQIHRPPEEGFHGLQQPEVSVGWSNSTMKPRSLVSVWNRPAAAEPKTSRRLTPKRRHRASSLSRRGSISEIMAVSLICL